MAWREEYNKIVQDLADLTPGKKIYLDPTYGSDGGDGSKNMRVKTMTAAKAMAITGKNDVIHLVGGGSGLSLTANLAWNKHLTHLIGINGGGMMNMRSRIGMSTAFTPMITITGYGCKWQGIYFQHGTDAADLVGVQLSGDGNRNSFYDCHFAGPMNALQASEAGFKEVYINGVSETYFKNCFFGNNTQSCDEASSLVYFGTGNGITIFEDCIFLIRGGDGDPYFFNIDNSADTGQIILRGKNQFIAEIGFTALTKAINIQGTGRTGVVVDLETQFYNVTDITSDDKDQFIFIPKVYAVTADMQTAHKGVALVQT